MVYINVQDFISSSSHNHITQVDTHICQRNRFIMQTLVIFSLIVAVALAAPAPEESGFYSAKYDNFDADNLVDSPRLLKSYSQCFLGKGPCTQEGKEIKQVLPEAIATTCGKCSPKQRQLVRKVMKAMKDKIPENWEEMSKSFDPKGEYVDSLEKFLASDD